MSLLEDLPSIIIALLVIFLLARYFYPSSAKSPPSPTSHLTPTTGPLRNISPQQIDSLRETFPHIPVENLVAALARLRSVERVGEEVLEKGWVGDPAPNFPVHPYITHLQALAATAQAQAALSTTNTNTDPSSSTSPSSSAPITAASTSTSTSGPNSATATIARSLGINIYSKPTLIERFDLLGEVKVQDKRLFASTDGSSADSGAGSGSGIAGTGLQERKQRLILEARERLIRKLIKDKGEGDGEGEGEASVKGQAAVAEPLEGKGKGKEKEDVEVVA